jgi:nitrous-oxide reductase
MTRSRSLQFSLTLFAALTAAACGGGAGSGMAVDADAAQAVYVAPGEHDEMYAFMSGGFSGNLSVYGLPSGRLLQQIPVFSQYPEKGYGYTEQTKALLETSWGFIPWDDSHHPQLSQTAGMADGRWLFINGNNTPRLARIDLATMETDEILELPHSAGSHASPFLTENTEYVVSATGSACRRRSVTCPSRSTRKGLRAS